MKNLLNIPEYEAKNNCRIKFYFDNNNDLFPVQMMVCSEKIFKQNNLELNKNDRFFSKTVKKIEEKEEKTSNNNDTAISRARRNLYDLIRCNPFSYFCTLTFNNEYVEREDYQAVIRKFNQWTDNRVRRKGLIYCGVVERHHQSNGLHFHILTNDKISLIDSGTVKCKGRKKPIKISTADRYKIPVEERKTVYNINDWSYGFSTAIQITGDEKGIKIASYLRKYLTKDFEKIGGRYYYSGGNLRKPVYKYTDSDFYDTESDYDFSVGGHSFRVKILEKN